MTSSIGSVYAPETVQLLLSEKNGFYLPRSAVRPPNSPLHPEARSTTEFGDGCRDVQDTMSTTPAHQWHMGKQKQYHHRQPISAALLGMGKSKIWPPVKS